MTEVAIATTTDDAKREVALLKAIGFDRLAPEQRELALHLANKYELDPMLRHIAVIDGRPVLTRDALLHIAHRSGVFDGIQVTRPVLEDSFWRCTCVVWRKDWSHSIQYDGRFPDAGRKGRATEYAEEMAVKCAESMALRRAFDVAAPIMEERWDVELPVDPPAPKPTLAERAAQKAVMIEALERVEAKVIDLPAAEPIPDEVREVYVNADEIAGGAPAVLRSEVTAGLSVESFKDLCVKAAKSSVAIAKAIECTVDQVGPRVKAMSPVERGVLADELNIDWRAS